jgi:hypothetical protein
MRAIAMMGCGAMLVAAVGCSSSSPMTAPATDVAAADWSCLGQPIAMAPRTEQRIRYLVPMVDFDTGPVLFAGAPSVAGVTIAACGGSPCEPSPDVNVIAGPPGQPAYVYEVDFPFGFAGAILHIDAPGYVGVDYSLGGPMVGSPEGGSVVRGLPIQLMTTSTFAFARSEIGLTAPADSQDGVLQVRALSCARKSDPSVLGDGTVVDGVQLNASADVGVPFAIASNYTFMPQRTTDLTGIVGLLDVTAGQVAIDGIVPNGTHYGMTRQTITPGRISVSELRPGVDQWGQ